MYIQDLSAGEPLSKAAQQLTAKVKQEGSPPGLPQHPAWSEQAAHSPSQGPIPAAREQHVYGRQLPPPPPIPQHRSAASYQQQPRHGQYHHASAAPNHPGGPPSAYLHPMQAQQQYQAGGQHSPLNVQHVGGTYPMGYAAGWPNDGMHGSPMQYGQQAAAYSGRASHGGPYPGPPPFPRQGHAMQAGTNQQGNAAATRQHGHPARAQAPRFDAGMGKQQQQQSNLQPYAPPAVQQQQQQKVQPVSLGQQAGSLLGAGLALSPELLNSLKSLAPALQQLQPPGT